MVSRWKFLVASLVEMFMLPAMHWGIFLLIGVVNVVFVVCFFFTHELWDGLFHVVSMSMSFLSWCYLWWFYCWKKKCHCHFCYCCCCCWIRANSVKLKKNFFVISEAEKPKLLIHVHQQLFKFLKVSPLVIGLYSFWKLLVGEEAHLFSLQHTAFWSNHGWCSLLSIFRCLWAFLLWLRYQFW